MRTFVSALVLSTVLIPSALADSFEYSTLVPKTAKSMAMGGVFTAVPTAEASFFGNPAYFALSKPSYAFPTFDVWNYGHPSSALQRVGSVFSATAGSKFLSESFSALADDGSGGGASAGISLSGKGVGLGFFTTTDNRIEGSEGKEKVASNTESDLVLGLGFPSHLGDARLLLGGDLRPFYRVSLRNASGGAPSLSDIVSGGSDNLYAAAFFGAALDLGASATLGDFTFGLSIRNIAPAYPVTEEKLSKVLKTLGSSDSSGPGYSGEARMVPSIAAGLSWSPAIAPGKVDPSLYAECGDIVDGARNWDGADSALELLHAGAEVRLYKLVSLRGGFNGGCLSAGMGLKLLCFDLNAAWFTESKWTLPGDDSSSGLVVQAAIRF